MQAARGEQIAGTVETRGTVRAKGAGMKIYFRVPPVSKRLHGWRRIARRLKLALEATLIVAFGHQHRTQDSPCIEQMAVRPVSV
jgi:precorrin-3B methylase